MAHYLAELYTPKQAWLNLTEAERQKFFMRIGAAMPALSELGVEALTLGKVDKSKLHSTHHTFFAVWRCPDDAALAALIAGIAQLGWHNYFTTINAGGEGADFNVHLSHLLQET